MKFVYIVGFVLFSVLLHTDVKQADVKVTKSLKILNIHDTTGPRTLLA